MNQRPFEKNIIDMMVEYDITMFDALLWDFEASLLEDAERIYERNGFEVLESEFRKYLTNNEVLFERKDFYADIFMGRAANMELSDNAKTKDQ